MKQTLVFIIVLMLFSCEYFNVKKTSSEAILKEELQVFNWNDVDEYPSFTECDSLLLKEEKKVCFQSVLTTNICKYLKDEKLIVTQDIKDTINLHFKISKKGEIFLMDFDMDSLTKLEIPNIKELINKSLDSFPQIFPAIKRGQQVTTEFNLPVIINVN